MKPELESEPFPPRTHRARHDAVDEVLGWLGVVALIVAIGFFVLALRGLL